MGDKLRGGIFDDGVELKVGNDSQNIPKYGITIKLLPTSLQLAKITMSTALVKTPSDIGRDIHTLQECLDKYQQLVDEHQGMYSMRAKDFFERLVKQIKDSIPQIALFTLISKYLNDNVQNQFYNVLDDIIESLQDVHDKYQGERSLRLFDFNEFIHKCNAPEWFNRLNTLFIQASKIAATAIIDELR